MRFLVQALLATASVSPTPVVTPNSETIAISIDGNERMTLATQVNGRGPYRFAIDTGADHSVVSDQLVQELGLPTKSTAVVYGITGPTSVSTVALQGLRIGQRDRNVTEAPVLPHESLGASGLIGLDALVNESVLFDFKRNHIIIARSAQEAMVGDPDTITVTAKSRFGQLILTDAMINGVKVYAIIDSGADSTIGNMALRKLMGRSGPLNDQGARIIGATGASLPGEVGSVRRIRLGRLELANMPVVYADIATFRKFGVDHRPAILIGMDVLRGFERVAVDFRRRQVRFHVGDGPLAQAW